MYLNIDEYVAIFIYVTVCSRANCKGMPKYCSEKKNSVCDF